jgi:hypothetical protein
MVWIGFTEFMHGFILDAEQHGCHFFATEISFPKAAGPDNAGNSKELRGEITEDEVRVCYTGEKFCINLAIIDGGQTLANGFEGWRYEKTEE